MANVYYPSTPGQHTVIFQSRVAQLKAAIDKAEDKILAEIGFVVAREAHLRAPVDTGNLANSMEYVVDKAGNKVYAGVTFDAPYAPFVEFGTGQSGKGTGTSPPSNYQHGPSVGHVAQPFLEPAVMESLSEIKEIAKRGYRSIESIGSVSVRFADDPR
jgi:HK97 gp10 family phage protein